MPLVTATDAAYYTGRPVGTIWRWASEGRIRRDSAGRYELADLPRKTVDDWTGETILGDPPPLPEGAHAA